VEGGDASEASSVASDEDDGASAAVVDLKGEDFAEGDCPRAGTLG
jgi:hypothetical protein